MKIVNAGAAPDFLIGGSAEFADKVEIHEMFMEGDVMKMRPVEGGIEVPAGGEVELKPGGYHVMFIGMKKQLVVDTYEKVRLVFKNAGEVEVEFAVEEMKAGGMDHTAHGQQN
ncbi:MAG: copper chaperone PCu(A)C [Phyllobacteriaceae bacterium]|nr:copper chaperone PCu(A)C [Phyllobacteriaceae bacterium]